MWQSGLLWNEKRTKPRVFSGAVWSRQFTAAKIAQPRASPAKCLGFCFWCSSFGRRCLEQAQQTGQAA